MSGLISKTLRHALLRRREDKKGCSGQYWCASSRSGNKFNKRFHFGFNTRRQIEAGLKSSMGPPQIHARGCPDRFWVVLLDWGYRTAVNIMNVRCMKSSPVYSLKKIINKSRSCSRGVPPSPGVRNVHVLVCTMESSSVCACVCKRRSTPSGCSSWTEQHLTQHMRNRRQSQHDEMEAVLISNKGWNSLCWCRDGWHGGVAVVILIFFFHPSFFFF